MIRRGDLDGRPPGMGAALFPVVSEMNGQHAPPTTDGAGLFLRLLPIDGPCLSP
jgi:hypothetical protein